MMPARRIIKRLSSDRHNNPEILRIITLVGAVACLIVFIYANVYYVLTTTTYDLKEVGNFMDKFSQSFAWILVGGGGGIAARNFADRGMPSPPPDQEPTVNAEY